MASDSKSVRVGYPIDRFEHAVPGVPDPLTDDWTAEAVSGDTLKKLRKVAKANGVPLEERSAEPLEKLTKDDLTERADVLGVSTEGTKDELLERVRAAEEATS